MPLALGLGVGLPWYPRGETFTPLTPLDEATLAIWYDAIASDYADGAWEDLSGNGVDTVQGSASLRPQRSLDTCTRWRLAFDGVDDFLSIPTPPDADVAGGLTIFFALTVDAGAAFEGILSAQTTGTVDHAGQWTFQVGAGGTALRFFANSGAGNPADVALAQIDGTLYAGVIRLDTATGAANILTALAEDTDTSDTKAWATPDRLYIGARINGSNLPEQYAAVSIMALGVYEGVLTDTHRASLMSYLSVRFLSLPCITGEFLLLETGDFLLLEDGFKLELE